MPVEYRIGHFLKGLLFFSITSHGHTAGASNTREPMKRSFRDIDRLTHTNDCTQSRACCEPQTHTRIAETLLAQSNHLEEQLSTEQYGHLEVPAATFAKDNKEDKKERCFYNGSGPKWV